MSIVLVRTVGDRVSSKCSVSGEHPDTLGGLRCARTALDAIVSSRRGRDLTIACTEAGPRYYCITHQIPEKTFSVPLNHLPLIIQSFLSTKSCR